MMEKYGRARVRRVVADFYKSVLASRQLAHYFDTVDVQGLVDHQSAFLAAVMGGPTSHEAGQLERAHHRLGISDDEFDETMRHLRRSLERHGIDPGDVDTVINRYQAYRKVVVGAGSQPTS